jgi:hypothetical protein
MNVPHDRLRRIFFLSVLCLTLLFMAGFSRAETAAAPMSALDGDNLLKLIGAGIIALLAEIWRNQRSLFRITDQHGQDLKELKGFCKGKNSNCGE